MYAAFPRQPDHREIEERILRFWAERNIFRQLVERNRGRAKFRFLDGPITANNPMGVHHAWGRTYKDIWQRYKAMQGFDQRFQNGFDCQGLWVEVEVERELGFKSKRDIERLGIDRFVEACKARVRRFAAIQTEQSIRIGQWMDWDNSYYTMSDENNYTIWHFLKQCHQRGLIYEGTDVMPWCARCGTAISDQEIVTEGYRELVHKSVYLRLPVVGRENEYLLVWTTTPWTLTANTAAAVHPDLEYVRARLDGAEYILARDLLRVLGPTAAVTASMAGRELVGLRYRGPFDELAVQAGVDHRVVPWDEVSAADGTGIVHIAPGCGKEDFELGREHGLAVIAPLDESGRFHEGYGELTGRTAAEAAELVFSALKAKGILFRLEDYRHRYPVCWRCGEELVFRLVDEWFIAMDGPRGTVSAGMPTEPLREAIKRSARQVRWIPEFGLERELDWLSNMGDWCISKKRYWGLALPIFKCECGWFDVVGSRAELQQRAVAGWDEFEGHSPHRPWVDAVRIACGRCGRPVARIRDVGNPWLDAGIVPFSTTHYLTDRAGWQQWFPFDFITESFPGQFRNWFYAILAMSTVLEGCAPFRTVLGYATMKAEDGREMHKSWGNAIEIKDAVERMGADVMRWIFARHNPAQNLLFGWGGAHEVRRRLLTLWNCAGFLATYAAIDRINPAALDVTPQQRSRLDRWIISRLNSVLLVARDRLDDYDAPPVTRAIEEFVEDLSVWYVRRSRRRFWKSDSDSDKAAAYRTLYECLATLCRLLAPFMPFLAEELYQRLVRAVDPAAPESVHLCPWPEADRELVDRELENEVALVRTAISLGRAVRERAGLKVRQPLARLVCRTGPEAAASLRRYEDSLREELNVKTVEFVLPAGELPPGLATETTADLTVGLDTALTPELLAEGMARELVHQIQNLRKEAGFDVADRIRLAVRAEAPLSTALAVHGDYIRRETLAVELTDTIPAAADIVRQLKVNGRPAEVALERVRQH